MTKDTMKAVVFKGPGKVIIEDRPIPKIKEPGDIIVKVDKVSAQMFQSSKLMLGRQRYAEGTHYPYPPVGIINFLINSIQ